MGVRDDRRKLFGTSSLPRFGAARTPATHSQYTAVIPSPGAMPAAPSAAQSSRAMTVPRNPEA
jgi:hypothetical protein